MNKKGSFQIYGFFLAVNIIVALMLFLGVGMHFITNQYAIQPVVDIGIDVLNQSGNVSPTTVARLENLEQDHFNQSGIYDWLFLAFMIAFFVQSMIGAIKTERISWFSFFGLMTVGNLLFGMVVYFSIQIRGWMLNEIFYNVVTETFTSTWFDYFINNSWWLMFLWYILIVTFSFVDVGTVLNKILRRERREFEEGRFEE